MVDAIGCHPIERLRSYEFKSHYPHHIIFTKRSIAFTSHGV